MGAARPLPPDLTGASSEPLIERLIGNRAKVDALKAIAPATLRFPGGSQSNFYDWKTGLLEFHSVPASSPYVKFWAQVATKIARAFPRGVHLEEFVPLAHEVGADVILVPNLETSTVDSQVAWFQALADKGVLPRQIELGNEFWIAMGSDPDSLRRWPDEPTAMATMHRYEHALRGVVGRTGKFAVQAAGASFWVGPAAGGLLARRLIDWDEALRPEPWFDAVTIHLYPVIEPLQQLPGGETHEGLFRYLMARCDGGVDRAIAAVVSRVPGKEIWVTEWAAHGAGDWSRSGADPVTPAMFTHAATRMLFAMLRHAEVTRELFFTLNFDPPRQSQFVRAPDGRFDPEPIAQVLGWVHEAARGSVRYQRVVDRQTLPLSPGVPWGDAYRELEGALFRSAGRTTLILQNAGAGERTFDATDNGRLPPPDRIEIITTPDLNDTERRGVRVERRAGAACTVPPRSILRVSWPRDIAVVNGRD